MQVQKSPSDKKSYRIIQLENGLTALLIHDPAVAAGLQQHPQVSGTPQLTPLPLNHVGACEPCSACRNACLRDSTTQL